MFSFGKEETQPPKSSEEPQASGQPQAYDQPQNPGYQPAFVQQPPPYGTGVPNVVHKETNNKLLNVALAIGSFGLLLAVIGVSSCKWFFVNNVGSGLFGDCSGGCPGWLEGTRALVVMGIMLTGVGVILLVVNCIPIVAGLACLVGGIFFLIGAIIFAANLDELESQIDLGLKSVFGSKFGSFGPVDIKSGPSHWLFFVAAIMELVAGVLVVANALRSLLKKK